MKRISADVTQLVVDRNVIRRRGLSNAATDPDVEFILTDTFLVEMVKHPESWDQTIRRDFEALAPFRGRLRISLSVSEIFRKELHERRAVIREELLPAEYEPLLDKLMQVSGTGSRLPAPVLSQIANMLPDLRAEQPGPSLPKIRAEALSHGLKELVTDKTLSDLRNGKLDGDARLALVEDMAFRLYKARCDEIGVDMLPTPSSMVSRFFILKVWRAMWWLQKSGVEAAGEGKLYNDFYDDEYILTGSFFDGTLSDERRVNEASAALRRIVASTSSDRLLSAFSDYTNA